MAATATSSATGPKSPAGKAASSQNAVQHGLTAKQIVLPGEDPAGYEALRQSLIDAHHPAEGLESILLDQIAQCVWRLNRARRIEHDTLERDLTHPEQESTNKLDKIIRYMAAIEREFHRSVRELTNLQSARTRTAPAKPKKESQQEILQRVFGDLASEPFSFSSAEELAQPDNIQKLRNEPSPPLAAGV